MSNLWTNRNKQYKPAITTAQSLLSEAVSDDIFDPIVAYLRSSPLPEDRTPARFFEIYLPKVVSSIVQKHQAAMQMRRLNKFGMEHSDTNSLILDPHEIDKAIQSLGLLIDGGEDKANYYTKITRIDEWVRQLYPNLRYLSEGRTDTLVRAPLSTAAFMLELTEGMIQQEESSLKAEIECDDLPYVKKLSLKIDLERTERLESAIEALEHKIEPLSKALHDEGIGKFS